MTAWLPRYAALLARRPDLAGIGLGAVLLDVRRWNA